MEFRDWLGSADNLTATMVASYFIVQGARWLYAHSLGRRRALKVKLDNLAFGNPVENIEVAFGPSVSFAAFDGKYMRGKDGLLMKVQLEQRLYDVKYGFLTVYFSEGAVVAYAFTLRDVRFAYNLELQSFGNLLGKLGRTTFAQFHHELPEKSDLTIGAQVVGYTEVYYFGGRGGTSTTHCHRRCSVGVSTTSSSSTLPPLITRSCVNCELQRCLTPSQSLVLK